MPIESTVFLLNNKKDLPKQSFFGIIKVLILGVSMNVNLKEDVKPISYIKTNAAEMIDYINHNRNPIIITQHGEAKGVFLDIESYQDMINALSLMKMLQFSEKSIREGKVYNNDQVFSELRKKIGQKNG
jgi:PHD/YefM family antitoxin component YafN of YafNO toxin-antitoxin module